MRRRNSSSELRDLRRARRLGVCVVDRTRSVDVGLLRRRLMRAAKLVRTRLGELSVALVDARTMARLHRQFLGHAGATDVLTFAMDATAGGRALSGEVVICVPVARKRAAAAGVGADEELLLYALHGLLHLSGFDDKAAEDFRRMHRAEDRILEKIGVGRVFEARGGDGGRNGRGKGRAA